MESAKVSELSGWVCWILRLSIAGVFIYAGATKAQNPLRFVTDIDNYHLLPWWSTVTLAFYLPWLEITCGAAVLLSRLSRGALIILLALTISFIGALASARIRGIDLSCGCFGHSMRNMSYTAHFLLNFGIIAAALWLLSGPRSPA